MKIKFKNFNFNCSSCVNVLILILNILNFCWTNLYLTLVLQTTLHYIFPSINLNKILKIIQKYAVLNKNTLNF